MKIFPAIDIKDKKCVRLIKGDFENKTEYEMSPIEQAGKYKDHGFKNLHIVDLDGALTGEPINIDIIKDIVVKFEIKIEIGGGVRNFETILKYINAGVDKVILGSAAIKDRNFFIWPLFNNNRKRNDFRGGLSRINLIDKFNLNLKLILGLKLNPFQPKYNLLFKNDFYFFVFTFFTISFFSRSSICRCFKTNISIAVFSSFNNCE